MKLDEVNLDEIKLVIFDFDETLAIHKDKDFIKHREESEENFVNFFSNAYNNPDCFYDEIEPCTKSEVLDKFIKKLRKRKIKMYCLSGMNFSFHLKAKQSFINKHYGKDIEVISASSQELKLKGAKILKKINNCNLNEIIFIDDKQDIIELLSHSGIKAIIAKNIEL